MYKAQPRKRASASSKRAAPTQKRAKGQKSKSSKKMSNSILPNDELLSAYRDMLVIRRFEERAGQLYGLGKIGGFCHLYSGQEAVITGVVKARRPDDQIITAYRDHGHIIACGIEPKFVMAELLGRATGSSKGKGGSIHMFALAQHFYGGHGIVGAQVPIGTGLGFANAYRGQDNVSLTFLGDGAANQGQVYESFNMAALWKLPVVYIIENNQYAMGTSVERASAQTDFSKRGLSFGIEGQQIDGMDVESVYTATLAALDHARAGKGPIILEMKTYRYSGHSMSDPAKYRKREEVKTVRQQQDPINMLRDRLLERGIADEAQLKKINAEVLAQIEEATQFAENSSEPEPAELMTDIYVEHAHAD